MKQINLYPNVIKTILQPQTIIYCQFYNQLLLLEELPCYALQKLTPLVAGGECSYPKNSPKNLSNIFLLTSPTSPLTIVTRDPNKLKHIVAHY